MKLQPPSVLNIGPPGSGKTYCLTTLLEAGLEVFVVVTEPDGVSALLDAVSEKKLDMNKVHWIEAMPAAAGWSAMRDMVSTIGGHDYEQISKIKSGVGKQETRVAADKLIRGFQNFVDERTGIDYGDVSTWSDDRVLVLDSLSGLNIIAWTLTVGYKPAAHQGEWGVAMNFVEQLIIKLNSDRSCFFVVNGHLEKEIDDISGVSKVMLSTLGRKLAPKIPRFFSEVVRSSRYMDSQKRPIFEWATVDVQADLKSRTLPVSASLKQDYKPIVTAYRNRVAATAKAGNGVQAPAPQTKPSAQTYQTPPSAPMSRPIEKGNPT